jgi:hypothetical protein
MCWKHSKAYYGGGRNSVWTTTLRGDQQQPPHSKAQPALLQAYCAYWTWGHN